METLPNASHQTIPKIVPLDGSPPTTGRSFYRDNQAFHLNPIFKGSPSREGVIYRRAAIGNEHSQIPCFFKKQANCMVEVFQRTFIRAATGGRLPLNRDSFTPVGPPSFSRT
jgi:hypothetical protein